MTAEACNRSGSGTDNPGCPSDIRVSILVFPRALGASIYSAFDDLTTLDQRPDLDRRGLGNQPRLKVCLVGAEIKPVALQGGAMALPQVRLDDAGPQDIVFVPACFLDAATLYDTPPGELFDRALLEWLAGQYNAGATVASLCTGSFLVAEAGLLDGERATVYSQSAEMFARRYRNVHLHSERPILVTGQDGRLVMGGDGIYHSDLMLYLIARFVSREAMHAFARLTGKFWTGDVRNVHARLVEHHDHGDAVIREAQAWLADHLSGCDPVSAMAQRTGLSKRSLARRFRDATGHAPLAYVQALRVERARALLEASALPVTEIAAEVGYSDVSYFSRLFRRATSLAPGAYRRRFALAPCRQTPLS